MLLEKSKRKFYIATLGWLENIGNDEFLMCHMTINILGSI